MSNPVTLDLQLTYEKIASIENKLLKNVEPANVSWNVDHVYQFSAILNPNAHYQCYGDKSGKTGSNLNPLAKIFVPLKDKLNIEKVEKIPQCQLYPQEILSYKQNKKHVKNEHLILMSSGHPQKINNGDLYAIPPGKFDDSPSCVNNIVPLEGEATSLSTLNPNALPFKPCINQ